MTYLLDTDICVAILRGTESVRQRVEGLPASQAVFASAITVAGLLYGAQLSAEPARNEQAVRLLLNGLHILPLGEPEAQSYAAIKAQLRRTGMLIADNDLFIAATTLTSSLTLVTHNVSHFRRVPGLMVEDWLATEPSSNGSNGPKP